MRALVNLAFLIGFLSATGAFSHWAYHRFVTGTALIEAAGKGDIDTAKKSLENGARVDADGLEGYNAMTQAIKHGHLAMVKLLIDRGADLDNRSMATTPLVWAAVHTKREIFDLLRARGARLNCTQSEYDQITQQLRNRGFRDLLVEVERQFKREGGAVSTTKLVIGR